MLYKDQEKARKYENEHTCGNWRGLRHGDPSLQIIDDYLSKYLREIRIDRMSHLVGCRIFNVRKETILYSVPIKYFNLSLIRLEF